MPRARREVERHPDSGLLRVSFYLLAPYWDVRYNEIIILTNGCENMNLLKKYWWVFLISLVAVLWIIPIIINAAFNTTAPFPWLSVEWESKDALSYVGSALGGLGTIFLGLITLRQTDYIKKVESDKEAANTKRPFFVIKEVTFLKGDNDKWEHEQNGFVCTYRELKQTFIRIDNVGDGVANHLTFEPCGMGEVPREWRPSHCISVNEYCFLPIYFYPEDGKKIEQNIEVFYENLLGYAYSQKIDLQIESSIIKDFNGDGESGPDDGEPKYEAKVFNIHPQIPLGMNRYNREKGIYEKGR